MNADELFEDLVKYKEEYHRKRIAIAKLAFREMEALIDKWERHDISFSWERVIEVDGEFFYENDLIEEDK